MAAQYITLARADSAATLAPRVLAVVQKTKDIRSELTNLIAEAFQMFDGNGEEQFTLLKTKLGVSTKAEAQVIFDLLNGTKNALEGTAQNGNAKDLATRIG